MKKYFELYLTICFSVMWITTTITAVALHKPDVFIASVIGTIALVIVWVMNETNK